MIRLPPSAITLGPSDLKDFEVRQKKHRADEAEKMRKRANAIVRPFTFETTIRTKPSSALDSHDEGIPNAPVSPNSSRYVDAERPSPADLTEDQNGQISIGSHGSPENASTIVPPASPPKLDLQNVGFVAGRTEHARNDTSQSSSPFVPEDNSTSPHAVMYGTSGVQPRALPRSPLFRFQNVSSLLEYRPGSLVASPPSHHPASVQNTTGESPERTPRRPNRTFRHQTNSFSFDDSVRASAAYEQDRISSTSTTNSIPRPTEHVNLREELRGSSSINERGLSADFSFSGEVPEEYQNIRESESIREHISPSAQLSLPPPFSSVSRSTSTAGSLPSLPDQNYRDPSVSLAGEISVSPSNQQTGRIITPSVGNHVGVEFADEVVPSLTSPGCPSPRNILNSAARLISSYRARSPSNRFHSPLESPSPSPSPTPRQNQACRSSGRSSTQTPSRSYVVYNDQLSPEMQPQTPDHLPESRHRSRYHPSYTAPVTRARARLNSINSGDGASYDSPSVPTYRGGGSPSRRRRGMRSRSPVGLLNGGFRGLYGGRENGNEEQNWVDGVRFNNAEVRLWGVRDARDDGRSLRETPERELWRVGRD